MHKGLKRFQMKATISDDSQFIRLREQWEHMLLVDMKSSGYVPVLALGPFWSTTYDKDENYSALLTLYGLYIGKKRACLYAGVDGDGTLYPL